MSDKKTIKDLWAQYFNALQKHEWDKSLTALNSLKKYESDNPQVYLRAGDLLQRTNDFKSAVNSYHEAAKCLIDKGFDHKALAVYKIILKIDQYDRDALDKVRDILMEGEPSKSAIKPKEAPSKTLEEANVLLPEEETPPPATEEEILNKTPLLFKSLSSEEVESITSEARRLSFSPEETVIREGDIGDSIFIILSGHAHVSATINDKTIRLATLQSGDIFGEVAYLTGRPRTATVTADDDLEVMEIGNLALKAAIEKNSLILNTLEEFYSSRVKDTINKLRNEQL